MKAVQISQQFMRLSIYSYFLCSLAPLPLSLRKTERLGSVNDSNCFFSTVSLVFDLIKSKRERNCQPSKSFAGLSFVVACTALRYCSKKHVIF